MSGDRRSFLTRFVIAGSGLIGAGLAGLVGLVAAPRKQGSEGRWRTAIQPGQMPSAFPYTAILTERHDDGWYQTRTQTVVFIDKQGDQLTAMSATCTHLGCHVRWEAGADHFKCPCHGRQSRSYLRPAWLRRRPDSESRPNMRTARFDRRACGRSASATRHVAPQR